MPREQVDNLHERNQRHHWGFQQFEPLRQIDTKLRQDPDYDDRKEAIQNRSLCVQVFRFIMTGAAVGDGTNNGHEPLIAVAVRVFGTWPSLLTILTASGAWEI